MNNSICAIGHSRMNKLECFFLSFFIGHYLLVKLFAIILRRLKDRFHSNDWPNMLIDFIWKISLFYWHISLIIRFAREAGSSSIKLTLFILFDSLCLKMWRKIIVNHNFLLPVWLSWFGYPWWPINEKS